MREIKFRGRGLETGEWFYGYYRQWFNSSNGYTIHIIANDYCDTYQVNPATVGQYTGLKDQNGTEIYEGDIIKYLISGQKRNGVVIWAKEICAFYMDDGFLCHHRHRNISDWMQKYFHKEGVFEVIGNIHENPEIEHLKIVEG